MDIEIEHIYPKPLLVHYKSLFVPGNPPKCCMLFLKVQLTMLFEHLSCLGSEVVALFIVKYPLALDWGVVFAILPDPELGYWHSFPLYFQGQVFL